MLTWQFKATIWKEKLNQLAEAMPGLLDVCEDVMRLTGWGDSYTKAAVSAMQVLEVADIETRSEWLATRPALQTYWLETHRKYEPMATHAPWAERPGKL